jgi:hypothetical protein
VRWWCSLFLHFDDCAVLAPLRWRARVALVCCGGVLAALLRCTVTFSSGGDAEAARSLFAINCLGACLRCGFLRAKPFTGTHVGVSDGGVLGRCSPVGDTTVGHPCPETWCLGVKLGSLLDERQQRHWRCTLLVGVAYGDSPRLVVAWEFGWPVCSRI